MAIYLKIEKPKTISELLLKLLITENGAYNSGNATYSDEACTEVQCEAGKWRSFDDIFELVNTYFPNTDEKTTMLEIMALDIKTTKGYVLRPYFNFCNQINMCTMMYYSDPHIAKTACTKEKGIGKYAWGDLLELLGITNIEELKDYIDNNKAKTIKNEETIAETV